MGLPVLLCALSAKVGRLFCKALEAPPVTAT